jgi:hypothetical protein
MASRGQAGHYTNLFSAVRGGMGNAISLESVNSGADGCKCKNGAAQLTNGSS